MRQLLILSGKGGTGKTTVAGAFIYFSEAKAYADCDVDAPNLHLLMNRVCTPTCTDYYGMPIAEIDEISCTACGQCVKHCRFDAIRFAGRYEVDKFACEGCGVCEYVCPSHAISLRDNRAGEILLYQSDACFTTARRTLGSGISGKLVTEVKKGLLRVADEPFCIIDGSPGIGCPVIASISGADLVLVVAEPSVSGISDMERIIETAGIFRTKLAVCTNKYDINLEKTEQIEQICREKDILYAGSIPFDPMVVTATNAGRTVAEINCSAQSSLQVVYENTINLFNKDHGDEKK